MIKPETEEDQLGMISQHTTIDSPVSSSSSSGSILSGGGGSQLLLACVDADDPGSILLQAESQMTNLTRFDASRRKSRLSLMDDADDFGGAGRRRATKGTGGPGSLLTKIMDGHDGRYIDNAKT